MNEPLVAEVVRSGIVESVHLADAVVVGADGPIIDSAGDPQVVAAFRSSAKPIQAGVCIQMGWQPASDEHLAAACASHNGEPAHVAVVEEILRSAGLDAGALMCPLAFPDASVPGAIEAAGSRSRVFHNCSGKHAAMLATCVARGWPLETYRDPRHPLQQAIHETTEHLTGALLRAGVDGCGTVTFAAPLAALARGFGAVAREEPFASASRAMRAHPFLVAGTGRLCTAAMEAIPGLVVKVGAEGLVCAATADLAIALKTRDGSRRAEGPLLLEMLRRHRVLPDPLPPVLVPHLAPPVTGGGRSVGSIAVPPA